jgi:hypothetical protein
MKELSQNILKLFLVWAITVFLVASCTKPTYAKGVHPHGELALVGYTYTSAYSPLRAFFMRKISMLLHSYGEAGEGHLRMCGSLVYLSTNPFQLCHPHLVVTGKAPKQTQGAHSS